MIPGIGAEFLGGYISDDGLPYAVQYNLLSYAGDVAAIDSATLPVLPFFVVPRHWVVQWSDGLSFLTWAVICPTPFSSNPDPNRRALITSSGIAVDVVGRVGERWTQFDNPA